MGGALKNQLTCADDYDSLALIQCCERLVADGT